MDGKANVGEGGAVDSVNGQTGVVVLDASDVGADPVGTAASAVSAHEADTTGVHGIADTSLLETQAGAQAKADAVAAMLADYQPTSERGVAGGYAELDGTGRVPSVQLPSYVDDVVEAADFAALPGTGETGKVYVTLDDNRTWRWSGSGYVEISASLALGETSATAYRGDRGKIAYDHAQITAGNPHGVTKADVGLGSVDNTSDADKPISTATQAALDGKQPLRLRDVFANRPSAATAGEGAWFFAEDTGQLFESDGAAWDPMGAPATGMTRRVGYARGAASTTTISSIGTVALAGGGLIVTGDTEGGPIRATFRCLITNGTDPASQFLSLLLFEDGVQIDTLILSPSPVTVVPTSTSPVNNITVTRRTMRIEVEFEFATGPAAGSHSWEIRLASSAAVTSSILGTGLSGANLPSLTIEEVA